MNFEEILKQGKYQLIDVREPMELEMDGSIENAINIPLGDIEERQEEIKAIELPKLFFCRSGNRSGKATEFFKEQGLEDVYNAGGYAQLKPILENL